MMFNVLLVSICVKTEVSKLKDRITSLSSKSEMHLNICDCYHVCIYVFLFDEQIPLSTIQKYPVIERFMKRSC